MRRLQEVEYSIKFTVDLADWESDGDIEHSMRFIWKQLTDQYEVKSKDLAVKTERGVFSVDPESINPGCNCELCNPKTGV